ncbi:hypothetical protein EMPG_10652 [Blastomyces silverae]|uniref:Uncharacterized protein n=1 Tax=Blastomyces silverae TaxID=2060906 RepID=A0A0H1B3D4_9EURO|nr:hypothetical protein EMPG_10652 [Blastomyces silverae]
MENHPLNRRMAILQTKYPLDIINPKPGLCRRRAWLWNIWAHRPHTRPVYWPLHSYRPRIRP